MQRLSLCLPPCLPPLLGICPPPHIWRLVPMTPVALRSRTWLAHTLCCLQTQGPPQTRMLCLTAMTCLRQPHSSPRGCVVLCGLAPFGVYNAPHADNAVRASGTTLHAVQCPHTGAMLQVLEGIHKLGMLVRTAVAPPNIMYYVMEHIEMIVRHT
jgi:hypothetical protein